MVKEDTLGKFRTFDSISPDALIHALARFGLKPQMLKVIRAIYSNRSFQVPDAGCTSHSHPQAFGICQGCPLSPLLFTMVMTVLMQDTKQSLRTNHAYAAHEGALVEELLYADDTLLIHSDAEAVRCPYLHGARSKGRGKLWFAV